MPGASITLQRIGLLKIGHGFGNDSYSGLSNNERYLLLYHGITFSEAL
jgi:hypothetical protein